MGFFQEPFPRQTLHFVRQTGLGVLVFLSACATIVDIHEPILDDKLNESSGAGGNGGSAISSSSTSASSASNGGSAGGGGNPTNLMLGAACSADAECASSFCRDGVCCGDDCAGQCQACSVAKKGGGNDGECGTITIGADPDNDCDNGVCDGSGACFPTPYDPTKYYKFINELCGKAAEVGGTTTCNWTCDGQNVQQWTYNGGPRQLWSLQLVDYGQFKIVNKYSGKALDVEGLSSMDGANIHQWTYENAPNQKWRIVDVGSGYIKFENVNSSKVLQVAGSDTSDGANIEQSASQSGVLNQKWIIVEVP